MFSCSETVRFRRMVTIVYVLCVASEHVRYSAGCLYTLALNRLGLVIEGNLILFIKNIIFKLECKRSAPSSVDCRTLFISTASSSS
jgi:hypothetical protein